MSSLAKIQAACEGVEGEFEHRAVLYIGSESYDAPTITLLRGLHLLGFKIYTIGKPNINSWHINTVVPAKFPLPRTDFVLSNLHWGTRWSYYTRFGLHAELRVLVDGDDNPWGTTWADKYEIYKQRYSDIGEEHKDKARQPRRWLEPIGLYVPDIVFAGQNQHDQDTHYLPFGIMPEYIEMAREARRIRGRFFIHITGAGPFRKDCHRRLQSWGSPDVYSGQVRGEKVWPEWVPPWAKTEPNVHSWHRWSMSRRYYDALSDARVFIYPGISRHHWESKRMWEALACACAVMICRPQLDTSDYPIDELFPDPLLVCDTPTAIVPNCTEMLMGMEDEVAQWQQEAAWVAYTYFTPVPIARYALHKILEVS